MPPRIPLTRPGMPAGPLSTPLKSIEGAGRPFESASRLGRVIEERGRVLKQEHDISKAKEAFIQFSGAARDYQSSLTATRKGGDAAGVGVDYKDWHEKESQKVFQGLENGEQQSYFEELAVPKRERDLDGLSRYEATENAKFNVSVAESTISNAEAEITADPWTPENLEAQKDLINDSIDRAFPGLDNADRKQKAEAGLVIIQLQAQVKVDPEAAAVTLEKNKSKLGGAYDKAKDTIDTELIYTRAKEKYPDNEAKQRAYINKQKGVSASSKQTAEARVKADKTREDAVLKQAIDEQDAEWYDMLFIDGTLTSETMSLIDNNVLLSGAPNGDDHKLAWRNRVLAYESRGIATAADKQAAKETNADITVEIDTTPTQELYDNFYTKENPLLNGKDYTGAPDQPEPATMRTLHDRLYNELIGKGQKKAVASVKSRLKNSYNSGSFGDINKKKTKADAKFVYANIALELDEYIVDNPDASSIEINTWYDARVELAAAESMAAGLNAWWGNNSNIKNIASGELDPDVAERMLQSMEAGEAEQLLKDLGIDPENFTDAEFEKVFKTTEFIQFKTQLLRK